MTLDYAQSTAVRDPGKPRRWDGAHLEDGILKLSPPIFFKLHWYSDYMSVLALKFIPQLAGGEPQEKPPPGFPGEAMLSLKSQDQIRTALYIGQNFNCRYRHEFLSLVECVNA